LKNVLADKSVCYILVCTSCTDVCGCTAEVETNMFTCI